MRRIKNPWLNQSGYYCFGCSPDNESGVKMTFYANEHEVVSYWKPESRFQGWVNTLHGGIQSVLLDEICAWAVLNELHTSGVTVKMETRHVTEIKRNLVSIQATLSDSNGVCCTEAVCTYFTFTSEKARNMGLGNVELEEEEIDENVLAAALRGESVQ